ncbi:Universal stress protein A-like protein [Linum perenne]
MPIFSTTFFKDFSPCFESLSTFLAQTPSVLLENSFTSYFSTFSSLSNPSPLLFNQPSVLCPEPFFSPFPNLSNFLPSSEFGSSLGPLTDSEEQDLQLKTKEVSHLIGLSLNGSTEEADKFISNSILHSMTHKRRSSRRSKLQMERRILGLPDIPENGSPLVIPARKEPSTAEHARAMLLLEYFINRSTELGIACDYLIGKGDPEEVICREAKRTRPDLVVLGCRGLDRFMSIFLPSVSAYVRRNCNCPMVAIKRRAAITPRNPVND